MRVPSRENAERYQLTFLSSNLVRFLCLTHETQLPLTDIVIYFLKIPEKKTQTNKQKQRVDIL